MLKWGEGFLLRKRASLQQRARACGIGVRTVLNIPCTFTKDALTHQTPTSVANAKQRKTTEIVKCKEPKGILQKLDLDYLRSTNKPTRTFAASPEFRLTNAEYNTNKIESTIRLRNRKRGTFGSYWLRLLLLRVSPLVALCTEPSELNDRTACYSQSCWTAFLFL
jgi:hypothetical protein